MLTQTRTEELLQQSKFIFIGTVVELNSATVSMEDTKATIIVRIDRILESPDIMKGFINQNITVKLPEGADTKPGEPIIFFTQGWIFEKSIAVIANGLDRDTTKLEDLIGQLETAKQSIADKELTER